MTWCGPTLQATQLWATFSLKSVPQTALASEWAGTTGTGCSLGSLAWPSAWNVSASGTYTHTIELTPFNMTGDGDWSLNLINGWASSGGVTTTSQSP